jgi:hypothetical protein
VGPKIPGPRPAGVKPSHKKGEKKTTGQQK